MRSEQVTSASAALPVNTLNARAKRAFSAFDVTAHSVLFEHAAGVVHAVEGVIDLEPQFRRKLEREVLGHRTAQFAAVPVKQIQNILLSLAAKRHDIGRGHTQVWRRAHLAHGDGVAVQVGIVNVSARQHLGQGAADQFAHAQLSLAGSLRAVRSVFCHIRHISGLAGFAKPRVSGY